MKEAIVIVDCPMKNSDFPMKIMDFPMKIVDFPMKNCDFPVRYFDITRAESHCQVEDREKKIGVKQTGAD